MDELVAKPELIASVAQDQGTWNLYTQQGEFFDRDPPTWKNLSRAEEILIKRRDWKARKRLLAYTSRRLRQERVTVSEASTGLPASNTWPPCGPTQKEFAHQLGVDPTTLAKWERGEREPRGRYADALNERLRPTEA